MKKILFTLSVFLFIASSTLSFAGIDYIQYREEFEKQEKPQAPLQHKSSVKRNDNSPTATPSTTCNKTLYHKHHKKTDYKKSNKKCNS